MIHPVMIKVPTRISAGVGDHPCFLTFIITSKRKFFVILESIGIIFIKVRKQTYSCMPTLIPYF